MRGWNSNTLSRTDTDTDTDTDRKTFALFGTELLLVNTESKTERGTDRDRPDQEDSDTSDSSGCSFPIRETWTFSVRSSSAQREVQLFFFFRPNGFFNILGN